MEICSMCGRQVESLPEKLSNGKPICAECTRQFEIIYKGDDKAAVRDAINYIYNCAQNTTDSETKQLLFDFLDTNISVKTKEKKIADTNINAVKKEMGTGFAPKFMAVVTVIIWLGGAIVAYALSSSEQGFNWTNFLTWIFACFLAGSLSLCLAELFENVAIMTNKICEMSEKQK